MISSLPKTSDALKFRLSSRLVVGRRWALKPQFQHGLAPAMRLRIDRVNTTDTAQALTDTLNKMVDCTYLCVFYIPTYFLDVLKKINYD